MLKLAVYLNDPSTHAFSTPALSLAGARGLEPIPAACHFWHHIWSHFSKQKRKGVSNHINYANFCVLQHSTKQFSTVIYWLLLSWSDLSDWLTECDWLMFKKTLGTGGKNGGWTVKNAKESCLWLATSRHKQTGNGELKGGQLFQIKAHGRRWGQCQWRSLQSGSKQATLHHHHYHPAASITGHGPAARRSNA